MSVKEIFLAAKCVVPMFVVGRELRLLRFEVLHFRRWSSFGGVQSK
jgi:hypothetical protein